MTQEWKDLPDLQSVAAAQAAGQEIECESLGSWFGWTGSSWQMNCKYRSRPAPKVRKVKMLAWFSAGGLYLVDESVPMPSSWKRVPAEDKEIEVEDV
jgi:hypothetical protein